MMTDAKIVAIMPNHGASTPLRYPSQSVNAAEASMIVTNQAGHS